MNHSTERRYGGANAVNKPLTWKRKPQQQDAQDSITGCVRATAQQLNWKCHVFTPEQWLTDRRPAEEYSTIRLCCLAAVSGDICGEFKLANIQNDSTAETNDNTSTPQLKQKWRRVTNVVKKGNLASKSGTATEQFRENETTSKQAMCLNISQNCLNETQETTNDITAEM